VAAFTVAGVSLGKAGYCGAWAWAANPEDATTTSSTVTPRLHLIGSLLVARRTGRLCPSGRANRRVNVSHKGTKDTKNATEKRSGIEAADVD
jgi:hypothetical protein